MRKKITKKYNLGGGLGMIAGAAVGSTIPVVGTALGAKIGGAIGGGTQTLIQQHNQQDPMVRPNQTIIQQPSMINQPQTMNPYGNTMGYALGGPMNNQTPGQQFTKYQGPTHEQGGIPLGNTGDEVEGGEVRVGDFIFSNRIQIPNKKESFADMAEIIQKKYSNGKGDRIGEKTMMRELTQLAQLQEGLKEKSQQQMQEQPQPQGLAQGPRDGSGPNGQMIQQNIQSPDEAREELPINSPRYHRQQQSQTQPQQFAAGGSLNNGDDHDPWGIDGYGKYYYNYNNNDGGKTKAMNMINGDNPNYKAAGKGWASNQFTGSYRVGAFGNPYASSGQSMNFNFGVPITRTKDKYGRPQKRQYKMGITPSFYVTPGIKNANGNFYQQHIGGRFLPNLLKKDPTGLGLVGHEGNNIGSRIWGSAPSTDYNEKLNKTNINETLKQIRNSKTNNIDNQQLPVDEYNQPNYVDDKNTNRFWAGGNITDPPGSNYGTWNNIVQRNNGGKSFEKLYSNFDIPTGIPLQEIGVYADNTKNTPEKEYNVSNVNIPDTLSSPSSYYNNNTVVANQNNNNLLKRNYNVSNVSMPDKLPYPPSYVNNNTNDTNDNSQLWDKTKNALKDVDYNRLGKTALSSLGGIYDVARGLKGGEFEYYNRLNHLNYKKLDPSRNIQQVKEQGNYARNKIGNIGGQGLGQYLNNVGSVTGNTQKAVSNVQSQYDNKNTDIINKGISYNSQIDEKNLKTDMYQNNINAKERDMASNDIQHGLTTIGSGFNQQFQDQAQEDAQRQTIAMIGNSAATYQKNPQTGDYEIVGTEKSPQNGNVYYFKSDGYAYDANGTKLGTKEEIIKKFFS